MGHQFDYEYEPEQVPELKRGHGEVSERFMELVLKTSDPERDRGFESHPLRQTAKAVLNHVRNELNAETDHSARRSTQEAEEDGLLNR